MKTALVASLLWSLILVSTNAQDFILQGCGQNCVEEKMDSAAFHQWVETTKTQALKLSYSGFTYLTLPPLDEIPLKKIQDLNASLRNAGMSVIGTIRPANRTDSSVDNSSSRLSTKAGTLWNDYQVRGFQIQTNGTLLPGTVSKLLNGMYLQNEKPGVFVVSLPEYNDPMVLANWIRRVILGMPEEAAQEISPRVYDYPLREALRRACREPGYDLRNVFESAIRDATALSGYNIVTLVNSPYLNNADGKPGTFDDFIDDPLLAYAYLLTNNQIGLPAVFQGDYSGAHSGAETDQDQPPLQEDINQLIETHQRYIFNATSIEYLNRINTDKGSMYQSRKKGADETDCLIFQLDGSNTPAHREVLVAINFSGAPLRVWQEVNMSNISPGDYFTDVLNRSESPKLIVEDPPELNLSNAVFIALPPHSYTVWVQGEAGKIIPSMMSFSAMPYDSYTELSWEIPVEEEVIGYEVQRSINGKPFEKIDWVDAIGTHKGAATYLYMDKDAIYNEELFYRVKMVSSNGGYEFSPVDQTELVRNRLTFELVSGRDPGSKAISVNSSYQDQAELTVFNAGGEKVIQQTQEIRKGTSKTDLDLSRLPSGVYFVTLKTGRNEKWTQKLVKY